MDYLHFHILETMFQEQVVRKVQELDLGPDIKIQSSNFSLQAVIKIDLRCLSLLFATLTLLWPSAATLKARDLVSELPEIIMVTSNDSEQEELPARDLGNLKLLYCGFISGLVQAGNLIAVILSDVLSFHGF